MHFSGQNCSISIENFIELCPQGSNKPYVSIGLVNCLAPCKRRVIIWPIMAKFTDAKMSHGNIMMPIRQWPLPNSIVITNICVFMLALNNTS